MNIDTYDPAPAATPSDTASVAQSAMAGAAASGSAMAVSELLAGLVADIPALITVIGNLIIETTPVAIERWAIRTFGTNDKLVLVIGIVAVGLLAGALLGIAARRRFWVAALGFAAFASLAVYAAFQDPLVSRASAVFSALVSGAVGLGLLRMLLRLAEGPPDLFSEEHDAARKSSRRAFLAGFGAVAALAALSAAGGRWLVERARAVAASRDEVVLPVPREAAAPPAPAASVDVSGVDPIVVPSGDFYKIDTALATPRVDLETWRLSLTGMVDRPLELSFDALLAMPMVERYITLACVSNEVGGHLVGNARWLGVPLARLLDQAGVHDGAGQVVGRSVDGFTVGFPTEVVFDGREALVAVGMNGEPLPFDHGFPARLVVAGLYGYVSATKWLKEIELTTWDAFDAYWVPRGWSKEGPIKTQSRIDVPFDGEVVDAGQVAVAGVAWAPNRGIERVEVQIDDGAWQEAEVAEALGKDAWRQWVLRWDATAGSHTVRVRATDGEGLTQTSDRSPPRPDGATGHHTVTVQVA